MLMERKSMITTVMMKELDGTIENTLSPVEYRTLTL